MERLKIQMNVQWDDLGENPKTSLYRTSKTRTLCLSCCCRVSNDARKKLKNDPFQN